MESTRPKDRVNTVEAKNNLNALIARAKSRKKPIIIEKRGEPVAIILDYETYTESNGGDPSGRAKRERFLRELREWHAYLDAKYPGGNGTDTVELLRQAREERMKRILGDD